jgi:hypothetical protein
LAGAGLLAAGVAAVLYVAGRLHQPDYTFSMFGADPFPPKSLLATIALVLAGLQVLLALWIYRRLPRAGNPPRPVPVAHRVTGFVLFAVTVPVAVHCLITYGVQLTSLRVAIHSIAGCFFYGAFAAKVLLVHSRRLPGWALPVAGGTLAIVLGVPSRPVQRLRIRVLIPGRQPHQDASPGLPRHMHQIRDSACHPYNRSGNYGLVWTNRDDSRACPGVALGPAK